MLLPNNNHLCYCFNVLDENSADPLSNDFINRISRIKEKLQISNDSKFAIGLWLNVNKIRKFSDKKQILELKKIFDKNNLYTPTLNAFPYSVFHNQRIKENVYLPDWRSEERLNYTTACVKFLSEILPENVVGSISTVPGGYKKFLAKNNFAKIAKNILLLNKNLQEIARKKKKKIFLAIEFEPDCIWEKADEFLCFKEIYLKALNKEENFIGICYDCAHAEVLKASPKDDFTKLHSANIPIAKIQVSAALKANLPNSKHEILKFADDIYLHQTLLYRKKKLIRRVIDLPEILADNQDIYSGEILSHYHLPLFFEKSESKLISSSKKVLKKILSPPLFNYLSNTVLEIETYTYNVLPQAIQSLDLEDMISAEYQYLLNLIHKPEKP